LRIGGRHGNSWAGRKCVDRGEKMKRAGFNAVFFVSMIGIASPAQRAVADDGFIGGVIGGVIGGIISGEIAKGSGGQLQSAPTRSSGSSSPPSISAEQREEQRRIQVALNTLGCDSGAPDGVFGQQTRKAIICFQAKASTPQTGKLTVDEKSVLLSVYQDGQTGVAPGGTQTDSPVVISTGAGALFATLQNSGTLTQVPDGAATPGVTTTSAAPAESAGSVSAAEEEVEASAQLSDTRPSAICPKAGSGKTALPGVSAPLTSAFVGDIPAIGFCELRAALMEKATAILAEYSMVAIDALPTCRSIASDLEEPMASYGQMTPDEAILLVESKVAARVTDPDGAVVSARLCAGLAYSEEDLGLASAMGLFGAAAGDPSLVELLGWHQAFGYSQPAANREAGAAWLREAADQMSQLDGSLLLLDPAGRIDNLMAVAEVLAPTAKAGVALPGIEN